MDRPNRIVEKMNGDQQKQVAHLIDTLLIRGVTACTVRTTWWQTSIVESLFYRRETL